MIPESIIGMATTGGLSATLGAGLSLVGKMINIRNEQRKIEIANSAEELKIICASQDAAEKRGGAGGIWIRRFIVLSLFGFMFGLLAVNGIIQNFIADGIPATYAYMEDVPSRWFGLIRAKQILRTIPLYGIPVFEQAVNMMWLIGTFYFGSSRIK
ncbi:MAG: hypothetical protein ACYS7Y_29105 [Planctomycetota bacterium]|jgi:hypothetical protein